MVTAAKLLGASAAPSQLAAAGLALPPRGWYPATSDSDGMPRVRVYANSGVTGAAAPIAQAATPSLRGVCGTPHVSLAHGVEMVTEC